MYSQEQRSKLGKENLEDGTLSKWWWATVGLVCIMLLLWWSGFAKAQVPRGIIPPNCDATDIILPKLEVIVMGTCPRGWDWNQTCAFLIKPGEPQAGFWVAFWLDKEDEMAKLTHVLNQQRIVICERKIRT